MSIFSELKSNVSKEIGLDETASGTEDVLLGRRLNQGVRKFLIATKVKVARGTLDDEATDDANLSQNVLQLLNIRIAPSTGGSILPERTTAQEILRMRAATGSGSTRYYALQGNDLLMFYPDLAITDVVTVYYVPKPTEMSAAGNDPSTDTYGGIPVQYHDALEFYACWRMGSYDDDSSSQMGLSYLALYREEVKQCIKEIRGKGGRSLGRVVIGRRAPVRSSPSQDLW